VLEIRMLWSALHITPEKFNILTHMGHRVQVEVCSLIHTLSERLSHQFAGLSKRSRHKSSEKKKKTQQNRTNITNYKFRVQGILLKNWQILVQVQFIKWDDLCTKVSVLQYNTT
jgi:hypothetical protein